MTAPVIPTIRYPAGPLTPLGSSQLLTGSHPSLTLTAYDGSIVFELMGGESFGEVAALRLGVDTGGDVGE